MLFIYYRLTWYLSNSPGVWYVLVHQSRLHAAGLPEFPMCIAYDTDIPWANNEQFSSDNLESRARILIFVIVCLPCLQDLLFLQMQRFERRLKILLI